MKNFTDKELAAFHTRFSENEHGCWVWTLALDRDGYGTFHFRGIGRRAHRVAWYAAHGEIPEGLVINHRCRNRACVNPDHLSMLTIEQNMLIDSRHQATRTHAKCGHPFNGREASRSGKFIRICVECRSAKRAATKKCRRAKARSELNV